MDELQFKSLMQLNNPMIINEIVKTHNVSEKEAIKLFYSSSLFEKYTDESTKIWHFSPVVMAYLLKQEIETGEIEYPVEG
jgi:hypothetical protein